MPIPSLDLSAAHADWTVRASLSPTRRRLPRPPHTCGPGAYFAHIHPPLQPSPDVQPPRSDFPFFLRSPTLSARSIDSDPFAMDATPDLSPRPASLASTGGGSALASPVSPQDNPGRLGGKFLYDLPDPNTFGEPRLSYSTSCNSTRTSDVIRDYDDGQDVTVRIRQSSNGTIADQDEYAVQRTRSISDPKRRQRPAVPVHSPSLPRRLRKRMSRPMLTEEYVRRAMTPEPPSDVSVEGIPHQFDPSETRTGPVDYSHAMHDVRAQMDRLRARSSDSIGTSSSATSSSRFEYDAAQNLREQDAPLSRAGSSRSHRRMAHDENFEFGYGGESSAASDVGSTRRVSTGPAPARDVDALTVQRWGGIESLIERLESETRGQYDGGVIEDLIGSTHVRLAGLDDPNVYALLDLLLPVISSTVVAVDVANNSLRSIPPGLRQCLGVEELRLSGNPLVALPSWLGQMSSLRLLDVDNCKLKALSSDLMHATNLQTILARDNRLISLPSWLSQLTQLETLLVDGNPFAGPWATLVAAIVANKVEADSIPPVPPIPAAYARPALSRGRSATGGPTALRPSPSATATSTTPSPTTTMSTSPLEPRKPHLEGRGHKSKTIRRMRSAGALLGIAPPSPAAVAQQPPSPAAPSPAAPASDKPRKWGFLKKMSMNKLRGGNSQPASPRPPMPGVTAPHPVRPVLPTVSHSESDVPTVAPPVVDLSLDVDIPSSTSPLLLPANEPPPPNAPLRSVSAPIATASTSAATAAPAHSHTRTRSYELGLKSIMSYLRDLYDLSLPLPNSIRGAEIVHSESVSGTSLSSSSIDLRAGSPTPYAAGRSHALGAHRGRGGRRPTIDSGTSAGVRTPVQTPGSSAPNSRPQSPHRQQPHGKDDPHTRASVIKHIIETEQTYVRGLRDLCEIYVGPAAAASSGGVGDSVVPATERRIVFGGIEGIMRFHSDSFLPALKEAAAEVLSRGVRAEDADGERGRRAARAIGEVFRTYQPYMRQYSAYINNFDFALARLAAWTLPPATGAVQPGANGSAGSPGVNGSLHAITSIAGAAGGAALGANAGSSSTHSPLTPSQRKRVKHYLHACRSHPKHTQINLESYLLLPVQRIPRYKMLLSDLLRATPDEPVLESALDEMDALASIMNEEKRDAESRQRLVAWQSRIRGKFPTPLVQAHRRLLLDGPLVLTRVVKRASLYVEVQQADVIAASSAAHSPSTSSQGPTGPRTIVQIDTLHSETPGKLMIACLTSDLMVLCMPVVAQTSTSPASPQPQSPAIGASSSPLPWGHAELMTTPGSPTPPSLTGSPVPAPISSPALSFAPGTPATSASTASASPTPAAAGGGAAAAMLDLYAVLRLQTKSRPATLVRRPGGASWGSGSGGGGSVIRLVDNKTILYLEVPATSGGGDDHDAEARREQVAERWCRALNDEFEAAR